MVQGTGKFYGLIICYLRHCAFNVPELLELKKTHLSYNVRVISVADIDLHGNTVILQLHINIPLLFVRNNLSVENS